MILRPPVVAGGFMPLEKTYRKTVCPSLVGVARPTLRARGLLGRTEPILTVGGRAMDDNSEAFVGIHVSKTRNAIAIAEGGRDGEVRFQGEVDASDESMRRVIKKLAPKYKRAHFCYEAGPTGYGLHRLSVFARVLDRPSLRERHQLLYSEPNAPEPACRYVQPPKSGKNSRSVPSMCSTTVVRHRNRRKSSRTS